VADVCFKALSRIVSQRDEGLAPVPSMLTNMRRTGVEPTFVDQMPSFSIRLDA
jgi:hypothetical protein